MSGEHKGNIKRQGLSKTALSDARTSKTNQLLSIWCGDSGLEFSAVGSQEPQGLNPLHWSPM